MKYVNCVPDLPFFETVLWHAKQMAAVTTLVLLAFAIGSCIVYLFMNKK